MRVLGIWIGTLSWSRIYIVSWRSIWKGQLYYGNPVKSKYGTKSQYKTDLPLFAHTLFKPRQCIYNNQGVENVTILVETSAETRVVKVQTLTRNRQKGINLWKRLFCGFMQDLSAFLCPLRSWAIELACFLHTMSCAFRAGAFHQAMLSSKEVTYFGFYANPLIHNRRTIHHSLSTNKRKKTRCR